MYPDLRSFHLLPDAVRAESDSASVTAVISTEQPARDEAIIRAKGWDFTNFKRNPVVLFGHDDGGLFGAGPSGGLPIARSSTPEIKGKRVFATAEMDTDDEFAVRVLGKIRRGLINATSVRWRPLETSRQTATVDGKELSVLVFERQELLEWSFVALPTDPGAVIKRANGEPFCVDDFCAPETPDMDVVVLRAPEISQAASTSPLDALRLVSELLPEFPRLHADEQAALAGLYRELCNLIEPAVETPAADASDPRILALVQNAGSLAQTVGDLAASYRSPQDRLVDTFVLKTGRSPARVRQELESLA